MEGYPPIAEHGLIGDLQTAALVTTDGTVDWWCCPRFDSPMCSPRCSTATTVGASASAPRGRLCHQAAVLPRHRHPDHPLHDP